MNSNPKYRPNRLHLHALVRWMVITAFLSAAGLSYVDLTKKLNSSGSQRTALEKNLNELIVQNNVLEARISWLTSRSALQRRLDDGFIKLVPISTQSIVHVRPPEANRLQAVNRDEENQFQRVSSDGFRQH